ncbi:MAG: DUF6110 family protein [Lachnospiraceae bacterium]|nr:DUF6110 family protein [Lachnospiraceae bacterium]
MNKAGAMVIGALLGSYGVKILSSKTMKKAYTHETAVVLRMKDQVVKDWTTLKENCGDIAAGARDINDKLYAEEEAKVVADAREIVAEADKKAAEEK